MGASESFRRNFSTSEDSRRVGFLRLSGELQRDFRKVSEAFQNIAGAFHGFSEGLQHVSECFPLRFSAEPQKRSIVFLEWFQGVQKGFLVASQGFRRAPGDFRGVHRLGELHILL